MRVQWYRVCRQQPESGHDMTNVQLYLAVGLPTLAVITSLVINIVTITGIRAELADIRTDIREIRADIKLITGKLAEMDTRISVIEERLKT